MTLTEQLDVLFDEWVQRFPHLKGRIIKDGIIDETEYSKQKLKILFITKEPNDPGEGEWDFRKFWKSEIKYSFSHRISEWAFGLINSFPPIKEIPDLQEEKIKTMKKIAFINLKKTGGGAIANEEKITTTVKEQKDLLIREIKIINPDLIIGGIGIHNTALWEILFPNIMFFDSGYDIEVAKYEKYQIVNYYHPSYRVPRAMSYALLNLVTNSLKLNK